MLKQDKEKKTEVLMNLPRVFSIHTLLLQIRAEEQAILVTYRKQNL